MNLSVLTLTPISCKPRMSGCCGLLQGLESEPAAPSHLTLRVDFHRQAEYFNVLFHSGSTPTSDPLHYQPFVPLIRPLKPPSQTRLRTSWGGLNWHVLSLLRERLNFLGCVWSQIKKKTFSKQQHCKRKMLQKCKKCNDVGDLLTNGSLYSCLHSAWMPFFLFF